jgi:shikimate dehydrogenase
LRTPSGGRRAAVLGRPIGHSLSPALHRAAYAALGLGGWTYEAIELDEGSFGTWFAGLGPEWSGLSLTMPLKRVVIPLLDEVTDQAVLVGAVNTVTWSPRGSAGANTDVYGIVQALRSAGLSTASTACVVGAGATAASAVAALAELGCERLVVLARSAERAGPPLEVAGKLGLKAEVAALDAGQPVVSAEAVVVTLPGAAAGDWASGLRPHLTGRPAGVLLDVSYHPWPTRAASLWRASGGAAVGGFEMLLHQAAEQVRLMTGRPAPLEEMRVAGEKALVSR